MNEFRIDSKTDILEIESIIRNLINSTPTNTIEEKVLVLRDIFKILSPLGSEIYVTETIISSANLLGLRSDSNILLIEYESYLNKLNIY